MKYVDTLLLLIVTFLLMALLGEAKFRLTVVDPDQDTWILRGCLHGLRQSSDRAELQAAVFAVEYTWHCAWVCLWVDSTYVAEGLVRLLRSWHDVPDASNEDLWLTLSNLLRSRQGSLYVQHVPGHAPVHLVDLEVDDWTARWNSRADLEAVRVQYLRPPAALELHTRLWAYHRSSVRDLSRLQALHLAVYFRRKELVPLETVDAPNDDDDPPEVDGECPPHAVDFFLCMSGF